MHSTLGLIVCASLAVMVLTQELSAEDDSMDKRARSFAFAKRARSFGFAKRFDPYPYGRSFAFAKRSVENPATLVDVDSTPVDKRARFAFAKRARNFAFAKRANFAFA